MNRAIRIICGVLAVLAVIKTTALPVLASENEDSEYLEEYEEQEEAAPQGHNGVPLYFQNDYPDERYGIGTVETEGCGITALAMVATYLTGHEYMPDELADYFGGCGNNNMERLEYAADALELPVSKARNWHDVTTALEEGNLAIALLNGGSVFTDTQHFIVLTGLNEDGGIMVNDPNRLNYEQWNLKNALANGFDEGDILCGYDGAWIFDKSAMPEDPFIYVEEKVEVECRYPEVELSWEEKELLARVVWVEAQGESFEGQRAVAEVAFNRLVSGKFGDCVEDVIYAEGQFRSVPFLEDAEPNQTQFEAVEQALEGPYILPLNVFFFATYETNEKVWGQIGGHIFCYEE